MSLREAAEALIADYDSIELEEGSYKVTWPQMEALRAALAEAEKAEPVAWTTDYEIEGLRDGFVRQLTGRSVRLEPLFPAHQVKYLFTHPPEREAAPVESALEARIDTLTTTLGALAGAAEVHIRSFDADDMPSDVERLLEETKVARAVLAAARRKG